MPSRTESKAARAAREARLRTVNGRLFDAILAHRHFLMRAENGTAARMIKPLRIARDRIIAELARLAAIEGASSDLQLLRRAQLEIIERRIQQQLAAAQAESLKILEAELGEFVIAEQQIQQGLLKRALPSALEIDLAALDVARIRALVEQPLGGKLYADRFRRNYGELAATMQNDLAASVALGEGMDAAARRMAHHIDTIGIHRLTAIARSEIQRVSNETAFESYAANQDIIKAIQIVATLDDRTCLICAEKDGQTFPISEQAGRLPPFHTGCRCFISPVTMSFEEMGLDLDEFPLGTRASMDGQVGADVDYEEWFNGQSPAFQRRMLGPGRFKRFEQGLVITRMVKNDQIIPIAELPAIALGDE